METPNKEGQKMPMLTPKNPDGSQRVIKQIMVIDPNKLRVAGLDLKMAEALKKSKGRTPPSSSESRSKEDKLALAKSKLNKKLKQVQLSKEVAKNVTTSQLSNAKSVEDPLRKIVLSNQIRTYASKPQIKVTDLKSLMPPPISPVHTKPQTILINFLKPDEKAGAIDVNFLNPASKPQVKIEADTIPKASIKRITGVQNQKEIPKTIESKVISSGVKFEMKKRPEMVTLLVERKLLPPSDNTVIKYKTTPTKKNLPKVIESKILSAEEKIDISTLRVKSPTKAVAAGVPLAIAKQSSDHQNNSLILSPIEPRVLKKDQEKVGTTVNVTSKPVVEESAVDFIKFMFETRSKDESKVKTEQNVDSSTIEEDATSFLMSLFGQQAAKSSKEATGCPTVNPVQSFVQSNKISKPTKCVSVPQVGSAHILGQSQEAIKNDVIKTLDELPTSTVPKESVEDQVNLKQEKLSFCSEKIAETNVDAGSLHHVNLQLQTEIETRSTKTAMNAKINSPNSLPPLNASLKEQPSENEENVSVTTVRKSMESMSEPCISPIVSSSVLKVNDELVIETSSNDESKNREKESPNEHNLKGHKTNDGITKEEKEMGTENDIPKIEQQAPVNKSTAPPSNKSKDIPQKNESKVEEMSTSTTTTRRKGKKSVPVLIAKLNRSRKSAVPQEKPVGKVEKIEPSPQSTSQESSAHTSEISNKESVSSILQPSDDTAENTDMSTVADTTLKSPRKQKDTLTAKNQENFATSDKKSVDPCSSEDFGATVQKSSMENPRMDVSEPEGASQNQEKQLITPKNPQKVEHVVSPSPEMDKTKSLEDEMTNTPIVKSREVELKVVETPTTTKRMSLRSTTQKDISKTESTSKSEVSPSIVDDRNINVSESLLPTDVTGKSENILKTRQTFSSATGEQNQKQEFSPGDVSDPQATTISKEDQRNNEANSHEGIQEPENAQTLFQATTEDGTLSATKSEGLSTNELSHINDKGVRTVHHEQENTAKYRTDDSVSEPMDTKKSDPAESFTETESKVHTTVKQRDRRSKVSKDSNISEKSASSTELNSSPNTEESISTLTPSFDEGPSPSKTAVAAVNVNTEISKEFTDHAISTSKACRSTKKKKEDEVVAPELVSATTTKEVPSTSKTRQSTKKKKSDEADHFEALSADTTTDFIDMYSPSSNTSSVTIPGMADGNVSLGATISKEICDHDSSRNRPRRSVKKACEILASEVMPSDATSPAKQTPKSRNETDVAVLPDLNESMQVISETEATDSLSDATISDPAITRTPRSRKKTARFEEYSRGSGKTLAKAATKDPEASIPTAHSVATLVESPQTETLTGNQSKRTSISMKGKSKKIKKQDNSEDGSLTTDPSLMEFSKLLENKNVSPSKTVPSTNSDNWKISDDSNGLEDCASDISSPVIEDNTEVSIEPSSIPADDTTLKQGKAKNPFRKVKPIGNEEAKNDAQDRSNLLEESGFLGFNEKEIEEGQQSTSLRLSQSEDVIPLQLHSPSESSTKKKGSPRVKKAPLSGGKKQKVEQTNWTKSAAESLRCWLKPSDNCTEADLGVGKTLDANKMNTSIPPKKRRDRDQTACKSPPNEEEKHSEEDLSPAIEAIEMKNKKSKIEESPPEIDIFHDKKGSERKRSSDIQNNKGNPLKTTKSVDQIIPNSEMEEASTEMDVSCEQTVECCEVEGIAEHEKVSTEKVSSEAKSDLPETSSSLTSSADNLNTSKKSKNKKLKTSLVAKDIPKVVDVEIPLKEQTPDRKVSKTRMKTSSKPEKKKSKKAPDDNNATVIVEEVNVLQGSTSQLKTLPESLENKYTPNKREKKESKKGSNRKESVNPLKPIDDFITPTKSQSRKRKRPVIEDNTPEVETPPPKIPRELDEVEFFFTPPTQRRRGRPPKSEPKQKPYTPRPPKAAYTPPVPVSPLEKKYKNDTEFNPRLLLIRQKEELKTDTPINDPDMQTVPKSNDDVQCALCMGYCAKKKWLQHISGHYGIGWIVGTPPPLNVKSRASVLNYMVEFFKLSKVKGLNCRLCQGQRRSALGLLVHLEQCCLTEDEIKESRLVCEHCNNNYSKASMSIHLRTCHALLKKSRVEAKEDEQATEGVAEEEILSNTGRLKRKSVIKAEHKFKNLDDVEFLPDELIKHIPQQLIDNHSSIWLREIQSFGKAFCIQRKCPYTATTVEELQQHCQVEVCPFIMKPGYLCMKCKFHDNTIEAVRSHVLERHKPRPVREFEDSGDDAALGSESSSETDSSGGDEEDENEENNDDGCEERKPKKKKKAKNKRRRNPQKNVSTKDFKKLLPDRNANIASHVAKWHEKFIKQNYSKDPLFLFASPNTTQTDDASYDSYFPKSPISMKFILNGFNGFVKEFGKTHVQPDEWQNLERLQGIGLQNEHTSYLGGPVKSIAWAPLEPHPPSMTQYLATAAKKGIDKFTRFVQPKRSRSLVYIQRYNISKSTEICGELHYAFPIDTGPIHCIEFLPSGGYAPEINRLGLLAIATVETEIKIYSLPLEVEKRSCDIFPIIRLEPSYELCLELPDDTNEFSEEYQSQCMNLVWSQTAGHNYIIGGYLNGYVAIWDISDDDDNLNRFLVEGTRKFVPVSYFWTIDNRIRQITAHYDMNGLRWLAVCNSTRKLLIYDLREITKPILFYMDTTKNVCNSIDWPVVWENISYGLGEAMPSHGCCINTVSPMSLVFINRRFDKFCCGVNDINFNPWKNVYAAGADNGDIHVTTLREAVLDVGLRMKNDEKAISTMDIVPLDGDVNIEETSQKLSDDWRLFETEYKEKYGLVFSSIQRIVASKKPDFYSTKRIPPLNMCRLMRVNRVRFNPNQNANALLAVGYDNGLLRVLRSEWHKPLKD